MNKKGKFCSVF